MSSPVVSLNSGAGNAVAAKGTSRPNSATPNRNSRWPIINLPPLRMNHWRPVDRNVLMLPMDRSNGNLASRAYEGKSGAICVAAVAYSHVNSIDKWHPKDVNKIVNIGEYLHKATLLRNRFDQRAIKAEDVINSFYIDFTKITTLIQPVNLNGDLHPTTQNSDDKLMNNLRTALSDGTGCMLCYDRIKYVALWYMAGSFYVFYMSDQDAKVSKVSFRHPCCFRLTNVPSLTEFLYKLLKPVRAKYSLISMKILNAQELPKYPEDRPPVELEQKWSDKSVSDIEFGPTMVQLDSCEGGGGDDEEDELNHLPESFGLAPYLGDFQQSYMPISSGRDILRGYNYTDQSLKIPCMNVAAISMLRITRAFTWTWDTLEEILTIGHSIYESNRRYVEGSEILASDIVLPVTIGRSAFEIECEHIVFGELLSSNEKLPNLERALQMFFRIYDSGVVQGPQSVAIWQELGYFYMFDGKERDRFGRKWTSSLANEFFENNASETVGCCCVTRFRDLTQLVNVYSDTVPLKHRHDAFRITRVQVKDLTKRSDNWNEWRGIAIGRWIIRGKFYQGNSRFGEDSRDKQATCIAAIALAVSQTQKPEKWNSALVNNILTHGDELYCQSVAELKEKNLFVRPLLQATEISRQFELQDQTIDLLRVEGIINGSLYAKEGSLLSGLETAMSTFFKVNTHGILSACDSSVAVWKIHDFFYTLDSNARDQYGRNPLTCPHASKNGKLGTSCALRFTSLSEMANFILGNFELKDDSEFQLSLVEFASHKSDEGPALKNYIPFQESQTVAILRPPKAIHEGNRQLYDLRADKQTLCNILVACCMSRLKHSDNWSKKDILDVLNVGDKMYSNITNEQLVVMDEFKVEWDHVRPFGIGVGNNKFNIEDVQRNEGILVAPPPMIEEDEEEEEEEEQEEEGDGMSVVPDKAKNIGVVFLSPEEEEEGFAALEKDVVETPNDLKSILEKWDSSNNATDAVLESPFFMLGLWKQDRKYFLFDPKARDENGGMTPKRQNQYEREIRKRRQLEQETREEEEDEEVFEYEEHHIDIDRFESLEDLSETDELPKASCIVMRFTDLSELINFIINSVPETYYDQPVTVVETKFEEQPFSSTPTEPVQSRFIRVPSKPYQIIRASLSQNDQIFPSSFNRNRQDAAICLTALSMATYCKDDDWTAIILDVILKYGDRLYTKSLNETKNNNDSTEKMNLNQITSPFILSNVKFAFSVHFFASGDLKVKPGNKQIKSVIDVLRDFFTPKSVDYGVLVARHYYVAVWCDGDSFFMLDSHEIGPDGRRSTVVGVACLYKLDNLEAMADVFLGNLDPCSEFNSFQFYKVKIEKNKLPKTLGICEPTSQIPHVHRIRDLKSTSAYVGSRIMRTLHGNMNEKCPSLKWHTLPPSSCHAVVAMATSIDLNAESWTPQVLDRILVGGNELFDLTLEHMDKDLDFNPYKDRLQPQKVRKDFSIRAGKIFVHMEMDLFVKGIIKPRDARETSLKCAISNFFNSHRYGVIAMDHCVVAVWRVCGYFYLFYPQSIDPHGKMSKTDSGACVIRFETFMHLYQAIMTNIPTENEMDWFEVRRCDFMLRKVQLPKASNSKAQRKRNNYQTIKGFSKYTILRSGPILKSIWSHAALRESQSAALCTMAAAMSCLRAVQLWSSKTLNVIIRAGLEIYRDARVVHKFKPVIHLHDMPRKITINDVVLDFTIEWPVIAELELNKDSLAQFFDEHSMAYLVVGDRSSVIMRGVDEIYLFDPLPNLRVMQWASNGNVNVDATGSWVCVICFKSIARFLEHVRDNNLSEIDANGKQCRLTLGAIRCSPNVYEKAASMISQQESNLQ